ncbi:MAG: 50S ribosomal protein L32, partial [Myxococcaceae bacterium]
MGVPKKRTSRMRRDRRRAANNNLRVAVQVIS